MNASQMESLMEWITNGCWFGAGIASVYTGRAINNFREDHKLHRREP